MQASDLTISGNCWTLLHLAAGMGAIIGLKWVLDQRVLDINAVTENGEALSVLQCAVLGGSVPVVELVLAGGGHANYK